MGRNNRNTTTGSGAPARGVRTPPNTRTNVYFDTFKTAAICEDDRVEIERKCAPKTEAQKQKERNRKSGIATVVRDTLQRADGLGRKIYGYTRGAPAGNEWMDDHCGGMWLKPQMNGAKKYAEDLEQFKSRLEQTQGVVQYYLDNPGKIAEGALQSIVREAQDSLGPEAVQEIGADYLARKLIPTPGKVLKAAKALFGAYRYGTAGSHLEAAEHFVEALNSEDATAQLDSLKFLLDKAQDRFGAALNQWRERPDIVLAEMMSMQGELDPCLRARKCMLVPYEANKKKSNGTKSGRGCCPGQTAHHVIPDAAAKGAGCSDYSYDDAPTICLEGQDNTYGSHGRAHSALGRSIASYKLGANSTEISYPAMRERALKALEESTSQCEIDCLRAQLDAYYKNCGPMKPEAGTSGGADAPAPGDEGEGDSDGNAG